MSLTILRQKDTFTVEGKIIAGTASNFKTHFNLLLNSLKGITIDVSKVTEIDVNGVVALQKLYENSQKWNKSFSIIGTGSKALYQEFFTTNQA